MALECSRRSCPWPQAKAPPLALAAVVAFGLLGAACSLPTRSDEPPIKNRCSTHGDCGDSGVCLESRCVTTKADLEGLLLQIDVPSNASTGTGRKHLVFADDLGVTLQGTRASGFFFSEDLSTSPLAAVDTTLQVSGTACAELYAPEAAGQFSIRVDLQPVGVPSGLNLGIYTAHSSASRSSASAKSYVPTGRYDVYVAPELDLSEPGQPPDTSGNSTGCVIPPLVLHDRELLQSNVSITIDAGTPTPLPGQIIGFDASGWTIDILENRLGRPISTRVEPAPDGTFTLHYWKEIIEQEDTDAVVRLTPPAEGAAGMPTVLWKLEPLLLLDDQLGLKLSTLAEATPQNVEIKVFEPETSLGVPSTVTIQSGSLLGGDFGGNLAYKTTIETNAEGVLETQLLEGDYVLVAQPIDDRYAVTEVPKSITSEGAQFIELKNKRTQQGEARTALGGPAHGVPALLQPSGATPSSYLKTQLSVTSLKLGGGSAITDGEGFFAMPVDPGEYDLFIKPAPGSDLPWGVVPRFTISDTHEVLAPLTVTLSHPAMLTGLVRSATGEALPGAVVRAFLPVDGQSSSVVQIAETTVDSGGRYRLLLPRSMQLFEQE